MNENMFLKEATMGAGSSFTENSAKSYSNSGRVLIDQFGKAGAYMKRKIDDVWADQGTLWAENPEMALRFPFYLRMITRQTNIGDTKKTENVQRGQGLRDESFKRLLWIARFHPEEFYRNLWLIPVVGSWKDLWVLLTMQEDLDHKAFFDVIADGIKSENDRDLVKKYLPRIRSGKKCKTPWAKATNTLAKEFVNYVGWTYSDYRKFKSTGKAHEFQRIICSRKYQNIKWNQIPGKALLKLVSGKFLSNHDLEKAYIDWLNTQPVAKFNGYAYELGAALGDSYYNKVSLAKKNTIDRQFRGLIETAKKDGSALKGNVLCALDTSGSMGCLVKDNISAYDVCVSLGIYFSELNEGAFHNHVAMFNSTSTLLKLKGEFSDKWMQIRKQSTAWGSTNFQSLITLICNIRREHPEIPLEEYCTTVLCVSDMQFNYCGEKTNYEAMKEQLLEVFPPEWVKNFKAVWWFCSNRETSDVPATMDMGGQYLVSGFDGAIITTILGGEVVDEKTGEKRQLTMEESVNEALNQEVLQLVQ